MTDTITSWNLLHKSTINWDHSDEGLKTCHIKTIARFFLSLKVKRNKQTISHFRGYVNKHQYPQETYFKELHLRLSNNIRWSDLGCTPFWAWSAKICSTRRNVVCGATGVERGWLEKLVPGLDPFRWSPRHRIGCWNRARTSRRPVLL